VSESSWFAIFTGGDSNVADFTAAIEQLSKAGFSSGIAEVSDEDLSGGFSLFVLSAWATGTSFGSFLFWSSLFDGQWSAFEFIAVESQSVLESFRGGELDKSDTLGSAIGASQYVDLLNGSAGLEKFLNGIGFSAEGEVSNEDFIGFLDDVGTAGLSLFVLVLHI